MKRRNFLQGVLGVGAASVTGAALPKILPPPKPTIPTGSGFGLAQVKSEGASIVHDAQFSKALWPGIHKWYKKSYNDPRAAALAESMRETKERIGADIYNKVFEDMT